MGNVSIIRKVLRLGETDKTAYRGDRGKIAYDQRGSAIAGANLTWNSGTEKLDGIAGSGVEGDTVLLSQLPVDSIVFDENDWEFKDGVNYSGTTVATEPVEWIVAAKDHEDWNGVALVSSKLVGKYNFDAGNEQAWETSDIRAWLNGTFKNHLTQGFQDAIQTVTTKTKAGHASGVSGATTLTDETILLLSEAEMAGASGATDGIDLGYFTNDTSRICEGPHSGAFTDWAYLTRSPGDDATTSVRIVSALGALSNANANHDYRGVRPALVLDNNTIVTKQGSKWKVVVAVYKLHHSTTDPASGAGTDGDFWFVHEA